MSILKKLFKDESTKFIEKSAAMVKKINELEPSIKELSDTELQSKTQEFKNRIKEGESLESILPEAFAVVREASVRTTGMRHYDVQLIGGLSIHAGNIAEMRTGEGKTLVATLPVYLNALTGKGVHLITVNDYLARRDAVWMGQLYSFLGLSLAVVNQQQTSYIYDSSAKEEKDEERDELGSFKVVYEFLRPCTRKDAYEADVTYGTNNEFGFDYLRDNLAVDSKQLVQKKHNFAVVDEIDSILIDEARTPLIISMPAEESGDLYKTFRDIASGLVQGEEADYIIDEKANAIQLTDKGIEKAEEKLGVENIYTEKGIKYVHHLETAVRAKALFTKDKEYVVNDGEVIIVDQSTGRMTPGRRFNQGLHQALEAKEGVEIKKESKTVASITYQNYFRMYSKLSGMTGTAATSKEEFYKVYGLDVITIPTNKPIARVDHQDLIFKNPQAKFKAIAEKIREKNKTGQPVLVGTISIEQNELLSAYLTKMGVKHNMLNAKKHESEGQIVAQAGRVGSVVIATNMAGRGVDIKLGGDPAPEGADEEIKDLGGLYVLGTERHDSRRIDNQLRGRSGRQGDPGETQFFVSLEDDLARVFGGEKMKAIFEWLKVPDDEPIMHKRVSKSVESAQISVEGFQFDSRKHTLEYDDVLSTQRNTIYARRRTALLANDEETHEYLMSLDFGELDMEKLISEKIELVEKEAFYKTVRRIVLHVTDLAWIDHLDTMSHMRSAVSLRSYGQRDPLVEYKKEGLKLFNIMEAGIVQQTLHLVQSIAPQENIQEEPQQKKNYVESQAKVDKLGRAIEGEKTPTIKNREGKKHGRNDRVTLVKGEETMEIKFKKTDSYLADGWTIKE